MLAPVVGCVSACLHGSLGVNDFVGIYVDRLVSEVVKASASKAAESGFDSCLSRDFFGSSHTSDIKIGTRMASLSGAWRYRVSTGTVYCD